MEFYLRNEEANDYREVEEMIREAFFNHFVPGCDEHYLAHVMRDKKEFLPELDVVAVADGRIVGNIMYVCTEIVSDDKTVHPVITFGPICVHPDCQGMGIGRTLIEYTKKRALEMGYSVIVILGDPEYYSRCGFLAAEEFGIRNQDGLYAAALQVCELVPGACTGMKGRFLEGEGYRFDSALVEEFDQMFPEKEKRVMPYQARFLELVNMVHP